MRNARSFKGMGSYGTVGIEMVLSILLGLFVGIKLDAWLHTGPWMSVVWFGFGCAAAGRAVYRAWKSMQVEAKREEQEQGNPDPAFPDDKTIAWQREEQRRLRDEQDRARSDLQNGSRSAKSEGGASAPDE